ncbi:hypothetical protein MJ021_18685 [Acinetobacter baumannii]|uniref:hypothetical protein n=4 Tax=Acinetobacter baumannii TaxID=470 RepID=UPI0002BB6CBC|nr:hypothetical protein [Acinetobacter baumannii]AIY36903.1 hypothetical protein ABLAC_15480 [Acinetobacter baumannii LAC-4]APO59567.1 hypothetical protein BBX32_13960 [Acinetobacter baumannii]EKV0715651.1 hypothetical protein [Acinetobacter baumannii]EKV4707429.1 hypothetical protein [Acinetobacter baumannii]EKW1871500.1 hypothetical protein [Acinetobacter baumannii]
MKESFKSKYKDFTKNHLLIFAFGCLGLLLLIGTGIINIFWGGSFFLNVANNYNTIKDYMALYLSMLGVVATLYASFVVIYAYDAWKDQKNFDTDVELLKQCDENLCRFKNDMDRICKKVIYIHEVYNKNKEFHIAHSLYRKPLDTENKYLEDFFIHIQRYLDYNKHEVRLKSLLNEYYSLADEFLYLNNDFINNIYLPIYNEIKNISTIGWTDSTLMTSFLSRDRQKDKLVQNHYKTLNNFYRNVYIIEEVNKSTGQNVNIFLNYSESFDLMNKHYNDINDIIKNRMRA